MATRKRRDTFKPVKAKQPRRVLLQYVWEQYWPGLMDYARRAGWVPVHNNYPGDPAKIAAAWKASGIVWGESWPTDKPAQWARCPVPLVRVGSWKKPFGIPRVLPDYAAAARLAAEHFIERGFELMAYCWLGSLAPLNEQWASFRATAEAAGRAAIRLEAHRAMEGATDWHPTGLRRWLGQTLQELPKPVGLLTESFWTAIEALEACLELGIAVPEQVAIVAIGEDPVVCENTAVPITTIDVNDYGCAWKAAELLDRAMSGKTVPNDLVTVPPKGLIVRQSSDILAVGHPDVAKALALIWQNYANPMLGVPEVVEATTLSRRGLTEAFRKHLKTGIGEQILAKRLVEAKHLLQTTRMTTLEIASACGYPDARGFRRHMNRVTGLAPRAWRRKHGEERVRDPLPRRGGPSTGTRWAERRK